MEEHVYLGIKKYVVCVNKNTGSELWRTKLKTSGIISLLVEGPLIVAYAGGELFGLARKNGKILWQNNLPGLGYGHCIIASENSPSALQSQQAAITAAKEIDRDDD